MLRRILIGLCLAITVIAAGLYGRHLWLTRHVVYVGVPTSINQYDDDQPVEATLHEYDRTSPVSSYQTTGRSISFSFARRLYTFRGNARGGPQRHIWISVDRMSLDGVDTEKEWPKLGHPYIPKSNAYVLLSMSSHLQIKVFSNQSDSGEDFAIKSALEEGQINPFARFCGVTWYLRREISPWMTEPSALVPSNAPGPNFGVGATVIGIVDEAETNGRSGSVSCNAGGGDCDIYGGIIGNNWGQSKISPALPLPAAHAGLSSWPLSLPVFTPADRGSPPPRHRCRSACTSMPRP